MRARSTPTRFDLPAAELPATAATRALLTARIGEGLAQEGQEIKAIHAWLPEPPVGLVGEALVLDLGGTNLRAARVRLGPSPAVVGEVRSARLQLDGLDHDGFFDLQARFAEALLRETGGPLDLPVGYVFSYPTAVTADRDATLIHWTKGVELPDVVGRSVGAGLRAALERQGLRPPRVTVLNDTVAALLCGAALHAGRPRDTVGLIVGTGTNMAAFFDHRAAPKLPEGPGAWAVNLESGAFDLPERGAADALVDARSVNPGAQRYEKAISGLYLPRLLALLEPEAPPCEDAGGLVTLRESDPDSPGGVAAAALLSRSARLVAAGLAAVFDHLDGDGPVGVLAEGGLFWGDPRYAGAVSAWLGALHPRPFTLLRHPEANLLGAALAACCP